jgi:hypothetical protein
MHVLVIGVSAYNGLPEPNDPAPKPYRETFGLVQLHSAATAACRFVEFLLAPPPGVSFTLPLKTCRLLLSPHAAEAAVVSATRARLADGSPVPASKDDIIQACFQWRQDAETDGPEALTVFYFAGHGFQVAPGNAATMLPTDFAPPRGGTLADALVLSNLEDFMYGSTADQRNMPRHQYYFVDACRTEPPELEAPSKAVVHSEQRILKHLKDRRVRDRRKIARFFAAKSGESGWGRTGKGTYFGSALRSAMKWAAVVPNEKVFGIDGPIVTPESLMRGLEFEFAWLVDQEIADGHVALSDVAGEDEDEDISLPVGPGDLRPFSIRPLLRLDQLQHCRVRFKLSPPGRGSSDVRVDFHVEDSSRSYAYAVHSGPLANSPKYWSSPHLPYRARVWRSPMDAQPAEQKIGDLLRPANNVTLAWTP